MPKFLEPFEEFERDPLEEVERRGALQKVSEEIRERGSRQASIVRRAHRQVELAELRGKLDDVSRQEIESFADRLIRENNAKQSETETVARHVRRIQRLLQDSQRDDLNRSKRFATAHVSKGARKDYPRTIFGTEAWIKAGPYTQKKFVNKTIALPCVERQVRRQVMAAKRLFAGYRKPHRRLPFTDIGC